MPELGDCPFDHLGNPSLVGDVAVDADHLSAGRPDLVDGSVQRFLIEARYGNGNGRSRASECVGRVKAQSRLASGHQRDLAFENYT